MHFKQRIRPEFRKGKCQLTHPIPFYDQVTHLVDEAKAVVIFCLHFSEAFDTISHSILLEKLAVDSLDGCTAHCMKN